MANPSVFISYSIKDGRAAGILSEAMEDLNMMSFLAHDDLDGGEKWAKSLLTEIGKCDVLVALITENSCKSTYAMQEVGAALAMKKRVLPVCMGDLLPPGFMGEYHRVVYDWDNPYIAAVNALKLGLSSIYGKKFTVEHLLHVLEGAFVECKSMHTSELLMNAVKNIRLTSKQRQTLESSYMHAFKRRMLGKQYDSFLSLTSKNSRLAE